MEPPKLRLLSFRAGGHPYSPSLLQHTWHGPVTSELEKEGAGQTRHEVEQGMKGIVTVESKDRDRPRALGAVEADDTHSNIIYKIPLTYS